MDRKAVDNEYGLGLVGQIFGLTVSLAGFAVAAYAVSQGQAWTGAIIGSFDLVGLASVFVIGRLQGTSPPQAPTQALEKPLDA